MTIGEVLALLESWAPRAYQESYDNGGLLLGQSGEPCTGILCTLDCTEAVILEAAQKGCNLVVAHHPLIFKGLKSLSGNGYVERTVVAAIRKNISVIALHTALDNIYGGVSFEMAQRLGLTKLKVLQPKPGLLGLFVTYAPIAFKEQVLQALFAAGAGEISHYSGCSFSSEGQGSFIPQAEAQPHIGQVHEAQQVHEVKVEVLAPMHLQNQLVKAVHGLGFYEEVAWQMLALQNSHPRAGSGCIGILPEPIEEIEMLHTISKVFGAGVVRHTRLLGRPVQTVAVCGGSGSFLTQNAIAQKADLFLTADVKYHEFFDADGRILLADIGHYESERFAPEQIQQFLAAKIPTFAPILLSAAVTNPVFYYA